MFQLLRREPGFYHRLVQLALPMVLQFTETLRTNFGNIVDAGIDLLLNLAQGIANGLPTLIEYVPQIVTNIAGLINDNAPKLLAAGLHIIVTVRPLKWHASWVQNVVRQFGLYLSWAQEICVALTLVREDRVGLTSGLPVVPPGAPPGIQVGIG